MVEVALKIESKLKNVAFMRFAMNIFAYAQSYSLNKKGFFYE